MSNADTLSFVEKLVRGIEPAIDVKAMCRLPAFVRNGHPMAIGRGYRILRRPINGVVVESAVIAGQLVTSPQAVDRYVIALNDRRERPRTAISPTPRQANVASRRAHEAAVKSLTAAGFAIPSTTGRCA